MKIQVFEERYGEKNFIVGRFARPDVGDYNIQPLLGSFMPMDN